MFEKSIEHHSIINLYYILCNEFGIKYSMNFLSLSLTHSVSLFPYILPMLYLFHNVQGLFMNSNKKQQQQNCLQENCVFSYNMVFFSFIFGGGQRDRKSIKRLSFGKSSFFLLPPAVRLFFGFSKGYWLDCVGWGLYCM